MASARSINSLSMLLLLQKKNPITLLWDYSRLACPEKADHSGFRFQKTSGAVPNVQYEDVVPDLCEENPVGAAPFAV